MTIQSEKQIRQAQRAQQQRRPPRQRILPFFIPMAGCAQRCVYCDQWRISGASQPESPAQIGERLAADLGEPVELAFYGGSFSALPGELMAAYLAAAAPALQAGKLSGIRISTRPDALSPAILAQLRAGGVSTIELGVQSFDDVVLQRIGRQYSGAQAVAACEAVQASGMQLGIQLMTGLPGQTAVSMLTSVAQTVALRPQLARIYPTLVLQDTPLAEWYAEQRYQPQSLAAAVELAALCLARLLPAGIRVIRLGLQPSPALEQGLIAGPYHPAFGQLVQSQLKYWQAEALLADYPQGQQLRLEYPPGELPLLQGQRRQQLQRLQARYPALCLAANAALLAGELQACWPGGGERSAWLAFLRGLAADATLAQK